MNTYPCWTCGVEVRDDERRRHLAWHWALETALGQAGADLDLMTPP